MLVCQPLAINDYQILKNQLKGKICTFSCFRVLGEQKSFEDNQYYHRNLLNSRSEKDDYSATIIENCRVNICILNDKYSLYNWNKVIDLGWKGFVYKIEKVELLIQKTVE